jgi:hypothetical protein
MAIKMEGVFDVQRAGTDGYLSDESDFYGPHLISPHYINTKLIKSR